MGPRGSGSPWAGRRNAVGVADRWPFVTLFPRVGITSREATRPKGGRPPRENRDRLSREQPRDVFHRRLARRIGDPELLRLRGVPDGKAVVGFWTVHIVQVEDELILPDSQAEGVPIHVGSGHERAVVGGGWEDEARR